MLYNKAVYWPEFIKDEVLHLTSAGMYRCYYGNHAIDAAANDSYGDIPLPPMMSFSANDIFEVDIHNGRIVKFLVRIPMGGVDVIFVLLHRGPGKLFCKTVWINKQDDNHNTLDYSKYVS